MKPTCILAIFKPLLWASESVVEYLCSFQTAGAQDDPGTYAAAVSCASARLTNSGSLSITVR
jgi:hypothetical protein